MSTTSDRSPALPSTTATTTTTTTHTTPPVEWPAPATARPTELFNEDGAEDAEIERLNATVRAVLRALNGCSHALTCAILVAIMAEFLSRTQGAWVPGLGPQAATLVALLGIDIVLDISSVVRMRGMWPSWAVLLRMICGIGYLANFMAYVGLGRVFPLGYTFWGIAEGYCGPIVYLFLWLTGVWNLLHTALHRHELGNGLRTSMLPIRIWPRGESRSNQRSNWVLWRSPTLSIRWRSGRRSRRRANNTADGDIELAHGRLENTNRIPNIERRKDKKTESLATSFSGSRTEGTDIGERDASPHRTTELRI